MTLKRQEDIHFYLTVIFIAKQYSICEQSGDTDEMLMKLLHSFTKVPNFPFMREKKKKMICKNLANQAITSAIGAEDRNDYHQAMLYVANGLLSCYEVIHGKEFMQIVENSLKVPLALLEKKNGIRDNEIDALLPASGLMARTELAKNGLYAGPI